MQPIPYSRLSEDDEFALETARRHAKLQDLMLEARHALAESRRVLTEHQLASRKMPEALLEARDRLARAHRQLR